MDKEHLIDLISNSIISEIKDLEINEEKLIANDYLNNLNLNQLRKNIDRAYNLELFNSIRYELIKKANKYDIQIFVEELPFHTMKLAGLWNNHHKLVANIKFFVSGGAPLSKEIGDKVTFKKFNE